MTRAPKLASGEACPECRTDNRPMARYCGRCGKPLPAWTWPCRGSATGPWKVEWSELGESHKSGLSSGFLLLSCGLCVLVSSDGQLSLLSDGQEEPLRGSSLSVNSRILAYPALLGPYLLVAEQDQLWIVDLLVLLHSGRPRVDSIRLQGQVASDVVSQGSRAALITVGESGSALEVFDLSPGGRPGRLFAQSLWAENSPQQPHRVALLGEQAVVGGPEGRIARVELSGTRTVSPWAFTPRWEALPWGMRPEQLVLADSDALCQLDPTGQGPRRRVGDLTTLAASERGVLSACGGTLIWSEEAARDAEHTFQRDRFACPPFLVGERALAVSEDGCLYLVATHQARLDVMARRGLPEMAAPRGLVALPRAAFIAGESLLYRVELR